MSDFKQQVEILINQFSQENGSNTPDFILAGYLLSCLNAFDNAVRKRDQWYGVHLMPGNTFFIAECRANKEKQL